MVMARNLVLIALTGLAAAAPARAEARIARCVLLSGGERYAGPCRFSAESGGSFSLAAMKRGRRLLGASVISVTMIGGGLADVRGLTPEGINSEWGPAKRSRRDRACWKGADFLICAP